VNSYPRGHHPASRKRRGQLCRRDRRNTTGCVGVSLTEAHVRRAHDVVTRHFFSAVAGAARRTFRIDTLGRAEAFRRAVAWRASYERSLTTTTT
jgi:hypothetical protein